MKKILFLIIVIITFETQAQSGVYHPFPDSSATWNWHFLNYYCTSWSPIDEEYSYTINGDTIIGSIQYHKLVTPFVQINNTGCGRFSNLGYVGCIRQSIIDKKVYCILPNETLEHLIFDFNLQLGDSIPTIPSPLCYSKLFISQVDSVLIGSTYRKRWTGRGLEIIEGIGSNWEFLTPMCEIIDVASGMLTCFRQNGVTVYPDSFNNCSLINNINSYPSYQSNVKLFPNPFNLSMTVLINSEKAIMSIYNALGQFTGEVRIYSFSTIINRNSLSEGIYFYKLLTEDGKYASGTFVVN